MRFEDFSNVLLNGMEPKLVPVDVAALHPWFGKVLHYDAELAIQWVSCCQAMKGSDSSDPNTNSEASATAAAGAAKVCTELRVACDQLAAQCAQFLDKGRVVHTYCKKLIDLVTKHIESFLLCVQQAWKNYNM